MEEKHKEKQVMKLQIGNTDKTTALIAVGLLLLGFVSTLGCQGSAFRAEASTTGSGQQTFASPEEAGQALQAAARANDETALSRVLGPASRPILSSGDPVEDKDAIAEFVAKFDRMNRWATMTDGSRVLYIGADNYPYPIPLVKNSASRWYFNTGAGKDEILARRIGKNELLAINAVSAIRNAEELFFSGAPGIKPAQRILSTPGKQDGLYWDVPANQPSSPLGRLNDFAKNVVESTRPGEPPIFDGYYFRILAMDSDDANGAAKSYFVDGKMTGGFAILASPVTYGDSGIMTFILGKDGVLYQRDLGPDTASIVGSIQGYDINGGWSLAE
jgi:Protein of unknown function (DUF2950)